MNIFTADNRGTISQDGNIMRVDHALIEGVSHTGRDTGHMVVSYAVRGRNGRISIELLRLNIGRNTVILNSMGQPLCLCDVRKGMWIEALFSSAMTRSIPPQSNAFVIMVRRERKPDSIVTTERVISVDTRNNFLITGNPFNTNRQMRFAITENTVILDRNGNRVPLRSLLQGQTVRVTHANFQTASIPPQTTAYYVQIL